MQFGRLREIYKSNENEQDHGAKLKFLVLKYIPVAEQIGLAALKPFEGARILSPKGYTLELKLTSEDSLENIVALLGEFAAEDATMEAQMKDLNDIFVPLKFRSSY